MRLRYILLLSTIVVGSMSFRFEEEGSLKRILTNDQTVFPTVELGGDRTKRSEPLTRHKTVHCFDENVKILGPKSFEVEKHKQNEETKMSIIRQKRRAGCTVKTIVTDDEPEAILGHRSHHRHRHPDPPKNFKTKTSYSISKTVTSPSVEHNFSTRHSSSSNSEISHELDDPRDSYPVIHEELPSIPHLPAVPHIGHEATYPKSISGHENPFEEEEPGPGEKTITFKTNTHRHEMVDQTGFVREKTNGYPVRPNDEWRSRFRDLPYLVDENGRVIASGGTRCSSAFAKFVFALSLLQYASAVFLTS